MNNIKNLGQVFTKNKKVLKDMVNLIKNSNGVILEPSFGEGDIIKEILHLNRKIDCVEIDTHLFNKLHFNEKITKYNKDFIAFKKEYELIKKYTTIIGNPPYVHYKNIDFKVKKLDTRLKSSNLYAYFILNCIELLEDKGELIFITPRDFLTQTNTKLLNEFIFKEGTFTHIIDLGDYSPFKNCSPNCIIFRFEKNNFSRLVKYKNFFEDNFRDKKIILTKSSNLILLEKDFNINKKNKIFLKDFFDIKVGAVSGYDSIFINDIFGDTDFVCSTTLKNMKTRKMIYKPDTKTINEYLINYKELLLNRKIKKFNESNWWSWGRDYYKSDKPRIYVNTKTRNKNPFFVHECKAYDGSILALIPKNNLIYDELNTICVFLNNLKWENYGAKCGGRFLFNKNILEYVELDEKIIEMLLTNKNNYDNITL